MSEERVSRLRAAEFLGPSPAIVLVRPQLGENIGAAARAMLNFGLRDLRIVAPRDGWPNEKAIAMAAGADLVVEDAKVYAATADAVADCRFVVAATARSRDLRLPVVDPSEASASLHERVARGEAAAVVFGGERAGLSNLDMESADAVLTIPANPAFSSLNLAQSVLVFAYEWSRTQPVKAPEVAHMEPATKEDFERLINHLFSELDARNYFHPPERRPHIARVLRAALMRAGLTEGEIRTLRGAIKTLSRPPRRASTGMPSDDTSDWPEDA